MKNLKMFHERLTGKSHAFAFLRRGLMPIVVALAVLHSSNASLLAQQVTADIVGRVTDATGALVPNAQVAVTNIGTQEVRKALTNEQGEFTFNLLQIGSYKARVEAKGFKTVEGSLVSSHRRRAPSA